MQFSVISKLQKTACLVIGIHEKQKLNTSTLELDHATINYLKDVMRLGDFNGALDDAILLFEPSGKKNFSRILLVGLGKPENFNESNFRRAIHTATMQLKKINCADAIFLLATFNLKDRNNQFKILQIMEIIGHHFYQFNELKSEKAPNFSLKKVDFFLSGKQDYNNTLKHGAALIQAMHLARTFGNMPANICTPKFLAEQAKKIASRKSGLNCRILDEKQIKKLGMNALLAVAKGSEQPPRLIVLEYHGASKNKAPYVIVGKGITFDSGGISLKPSGEMDEMKYDMSGAATVIALLRAAAQLKLPINVVGIAACAENLPSGSATKPGDIVKTMSGQTVEILNTDAEGRLVLCDALTYAERYRPQAVIDIATLTGAIIIALGRFPSGLFTNDDGLAHALEKAATESYDRIWRMPLWEDYQTSLSSNFADMANISSDRGAGSITAACYLARFTKKYPWAHLDIAGTAWMSGKDKNSLGRPLPLLLQYLLNQSHK